MRNSFFYTAAVFIVIAILLNFTLSDPTFKTLQEKAKFELNSNHPELAEKTYLEIIDNNLLNIDEHYNYIHAHFEIPKEKKVGKNEYEYRDDNTILSYYESFTEVTDENLVDIGSYGIGLIRVNLDDYKSAIYSFESIQNKNLKYLNNSLGNAYAEIGAFKKAEIHFRKEIENKGNLSGAYSNLIKLLYKQGRNDEVEHFLENPEAKSFFPSNIERKIYFEKVQPINYFNALIKRTFSGLNLFGFLAAFLIMGSWIMYLRKIDVFDVERWRHIIAVAMMGMILSLVTFPLSDFNNAIFGFELNGEIINDFLYCVIGIGAIEEFVKIIPLLLILRFTKIINEPFDYIVYASISALGFAFIENLIYFDEGSLHIIHGRALISVVSHMFDSSIIAYGLMLNKYKRRWNPYLNFLFFFALAAIAHGFYDFWLINEAASSFSIITILFFLVSLSMWNSFKNNSLNQSSFYDKNRLINNEKLADYLFYSLAGVLLFEYIALGFKFGPTMANKGFVESILSGTYLIFFLSTSLSRFKLKKGEWAPIEYWGKEEEIDFEKIVGEKIRINRFTKNKLTLDFLPDDAWVLETLTVSKEPDWYLIQLSETVDTKVNMRDLVAIRTKDKQQQLLKGNDTFVAFYVIPIETDLKSKELTRADFVFCGWAKVV
ncbi:MAG: PrsW family intramembrane metalloprotease [Crocinitomicaceae bacterium]|nr:PrsW family intramembrane metalloprotease [Crocinitomicaceae bacterium]